MNREQRNLDKLRSARHARIEQKRKKFGNPRRAESMVMVQLDHFHQQDQIAAQRFAREMEQLQLANKIMGEEFDKFGTRTDEHAEEPE